MSPAFAVVATILTVVCLAPQAHLTHQNVDGLSVSTTILGTWSAAAWLAYGITITDGAQITTNVICLILRVTMIAGLVRACHQQRVPLAAAVGCAGITVAAFAGGTAALGPIAVILGLTNGLPQGYLSLRYGVGDGVSISSLVLSAAAAVAWALYGATVHDAPVTICAVLGAGGNAAMLARAAFTPRARCPIPATPLTETA